MSWVPLSRRKPRRAVPVRNFRPTLEGLEERCLLDANPPAGNIFQIASQAILSLEQTRQVIHAAVQAVQQQETADVLTLARDYAAAKQDADQQVVQAEVKLAQDQATGTPDVLDLDRAQAAQQTAAQVDADTAAADLKLLRQFQADVQQNQQVQNTADQAVNNVENQVISSLGAAINGGAGGGNIGGGTGGGTGGGGGTVQGNLGDFPFGTYQESSPSSSVSDSGAMSATNVNVQGGSLQANVMLSDKAVIDPTTFQKVGTSGTTGTLTATQQPNGTFQGNLNLTFTRPDVAGETVTEQVQNVTVNASTIQGNIVVSGQNVGSFIVQK